MRYENELNQKYELMEEKSWRSCSFGASRAWQRRFTKTSLLSQENQESITPQDIRSLADISRLPTTRKQDCETIILCSSCPREDVVRSCLIRHHRQATVVATPPKIETWLNSWPATSSWSAWEGGHLPECGEYGFFTGPGGALRHRTLGAMAVPSGVGNTERQLEIMMDFGVTVLHCTHPMPLSGERPRQRRVESQVRIGCFGAEPGLMSQDGSLRRPASQGLRFLRALEMMVQEWHLSARAERCTSGRTLLDRDSGPERAGLPRASRASWS